MHHDLPASFGAKLKGCDELFDKLLALRKLGFSCGVAAVEQNHNVRASMRKDVAADGGAYA